MVLPRIALRACAIATELHLAAVVSDRSSLSLFSPTLLGRRRATGLASSAHPHCRAGVGNDGSVCKLAVGDSSPQTALDRPRAAGLMREACHQVRACSRSNG